MVLDGTKSINCWDKEGKQKVIDIIYGLITVLLTLSKTTNLGKKQAELNGFNLPNKEGDTCLFAALKEKNTDAALLMINSQMLDITAKKEKSHLTALHLIAFLVKEEPTLKEIFKKIDNSKLMTEDRNGNTPLHYAAYARNLAMATLLCEK